MTFIKGNLCELRVLAGSDEEVKLWTHAVMAGLTTQHLFSGSIPMRYIDVKAQWDKERLAGDILFGIWLPYRNQEKLYCTGQYSALEISRECNLVFPHNPHERVLIPEKPEKMIGTCGLHQHREIYRSFEARWLIFDPSAVGKGIGAEAVDLLTTYAFERLNAHRVWLGVSEDNTRAFKCYVDAGYKVEGRLRDELYYHGSYHAAIRMSVLESEWPSRVAT